MRVQQELFRPNSRYWLAFVYILDKLRYEGIGESYAEMCEILPGRCQIVAKIWNCVFQVHNNLGDVRALVTNVVEVQPGYFSHSLKSWLTSHLQILDEELDAVADHLVEQILFRGQVYLVRQVGGDLLL